MNRDDGRIDATLEAIVADRRSGAAEIASKLVEWSGAIETDGEESLVAAKAGLKRVARAQAALAPVLRIANDLLVEIERGRATPEATKEALRSVSDDWRARLAAAEESISVHLGRLLEGVETVYTYSSSSTIRGALLAHQARGAWFQVVVSESRPGGEGARLAARLAEREIPVALGTDAWLWGAIEEPGVLLVGADALLPAAWVNKIGTAALADRARARGIEVVVAADTSKWLPPVLAAIPRVYDRDPAEIVFNAPPALTPHNIYFEDIPYAALDRLVTERGITRPADLRGGEIPIAEALR